MPWITISPNYLYWLNQLHALHALHVLTWCSYLTSKPRNYALLISGFWNRFECVCSVNVCWISSRNAKMDLLPKSLGLYFFSYQLFQAMTPFKKYLVGTQWWFNVVGRRRRACLWAPIQRPCCVQWVSPFLLTMCPRLTWSGKDQWAMA